MISDINESETVMDGGDALRRHDGDKLRELSYLAAAVSHHVINAFSAIVSNAELIRSREDGTIDTADLETLAATIVDRAIEASDVARLLIEWARRASPLEGDKTGRTSPAVDINTLIREMITSEKSLAPSQVDWVLRLGSIPSIPGSFGGLGAMLGFLLRNAREALLDGAGTVEVSTDIDARNWLVIAIRDTGCGMTPEILKRASEPFFSTKPGHSGVGLTIAQAIWRRNRGALSIDSHAGLGTTIRLSIPPIAPQPRVDRAPLADYQKPS